MTTLEEIIKIVTQGIISELKPFITDALNERLPNDREKPPPEELLTISEAAAFLNCSRTTLWSYTKKNYIDSYRIGQKVFFKKSELMKSLKKRSSKSK